MDAGTAGPVEDSPEISLPAKGEISGGGQRERAAGAEDPRAPSQARWQRPQGEPKVFAQALVGPNIRYTRRITFDAVLVYYIFFHLCGKASGSSWILLT